MRRRARVVAAAVVGAATIAAGMGIAAATGGEDHEQPITGEALTRASAAAISHTGGGHVTGTEIGDEDGYYEVEITLADGQQVDVHLDSSFNVLATKADQERPDDPSP